ncbi:MAG: hypothetical protein LBC90_07075, partial [Candidatus Adiutrix sp.]|nr:hypothetical protein [Candidatus Adiutrix sp.]
MNKKYLKTMLAALAWGLFSLLPAAGPALAQTPSDPNPQNYQTTPFWLEGTAIPQVMLVLERDWKMYYPAYNNLTNLEGDGDPLNTPDIGFNPAVTYVGYFDPNSCYGYGPPASNAPGYSSTGGGNGSRFFRVGPTKAQTVKDLEDMIEANGINKHGRHIDALKGHGSFDPYPSDKLNNW